MVASPRATAVSVRIAPPSFYGDLDGALERAIPDSEERQALRGVLWQIIEWQRLTAEVLNNAMQGKLNNGGQVTLTANVATTTVTDSRIGTDTKLVLVPTTANAAAEVGAGGLFQTFPNSLKEQAVLNHASNGQTDRTFQFALLG